MTERDQSTYEEGVPPPFEITKECVLAWWRKLSVHEGIQEKLAELFTFV